MPLQLAGAPFSEIRNALPFRSDEAGRAMAKTALRRALEPPRVRLLTQFTTIPDGMKFLVELRAELLQLMRDDALLQALETDLRGLLASWFEAVHVLGLEPGPYW